MRLKEFPRKEILLASKIGFLTKKLWREFYAQGSDSWKRKQWRRLVTDGLFQKHPSRFAQDTLILNLRNRLVQNELRTEPVRFPFVSQLTHDELVAWSILKIIRSDLLMYFKVEMELKQTDLATGTHLRDAAHKKYPDALLITKLQGKSLTVALEIELTLKSRKRYQEIFISYMRRDDISYVIYVCKTPGIARAIERMKANGFTHRGPQIGVVSLVAWEKDPATALIKFGFTHKSLADLCKPNMS